MRRASGGLLGAALLLAVCGRGDEAAIRRCFAEYRQALLDERGRQAVRLVDSGTIGYYERMRRLALTAAAEDVRALPILDKLMVLRLRHDVPPSKLRTATGADLFALAVDESLVGEEAVRSADLGAITVQGRQATARVLADGKPLPLSFRFVREEGSWRIDVVAMTVEAGRSLRAMVETAGGSEHTLVLDLIEKLSGRRPDPSIWRPPGE